MSDRRPFSFSDSDLISSLVAFTESTVGRLLQAFEVYIIAVFLVVTAFLRHRHILPSTTPSQGRTRKDILLTLPEPARGSTFRITPPIIETPRMSTILGAATQNIDSSREVLRRSARRSLNHVSSWVSFRRNRARHEDEEVRLWSAEKVKVDAPYTGSIDTELRTSIIPSLDAQSAIGRSMEGSIHSGRTLHPSRADGSQHTIPLRVRTSSVPISSVPSPIPGLKHARSMAATPEASPVYGLDGIQSLASASESRTSIDELLRQQSQLDQTIEALKLFSARTSINSSHSNSARSVELTRSLSTGQRTVSSDVSLSNFPVPPWLTTPVPSLPSSRPSSIKRIRGDRRVRLAAAQSTPVQDTYASVPPTTSASPVDIPSSPRLNSIPHSPLGEENESLSTEAGKPYRYDSGGTQYNVTSFIGGTLFVGASDSISDVLEGLATPGEPRQEKPWWPTENEPSVEVIRTSSGTKKLPPRTLPIPRRLEGLPASPAVGNLSPLARSSRLFQGDVADEPPNVMQCRTKDQTSCALPVAPSTQTPGTGHGEKGVPIPPPKPQLVREIDSPISAGGLDRVQRMFVRPRPPPLAIQSYTEQNPGITRVQVLADD